MANGGNLEEYCLHYVAYKGVAEPIRLLLTYLNLEWTEKLHPVSFLQDELFQEGFLTLYNLENGILNGLKFLQCERVFLQKCHLVG